MRAYVAVTGIVFAGLLAVHVARLIAEGWGPLGDPIFAVTTILSLAIALWSLAQWRRSRR